MDIKPLARASIPYILTAGITLGVAGFAGNAFGIQDAVTDAATSVRRSIAQAVISDDPAEFVATVQPVMRNFSGIAGTASTTTTVVRRKLLRHSSKKPSGTSRLKSAAPHFKASLMPTFLRCRVKQLRILCNTHLNASALTTPALK